MKSTEQDEEIIYRFLIGDVEDSELRDWLNERPENSKCLEKICRELKIAEEGKIFYHLEDEVAWQDFKLKCSHQAAGKWRIRRFLRYAAILVLPLMVAFAGWMLYQQRGESLPDSVSRNIIPGDSQAILVLGNGEQKILQGKEQDEVEISEGIKAKQDGQVLRYDSAILTLSNPHQGVYNTLKTPRGGEFQIVLSDGTRVWMNSESQLRYPVHFSGTERRVFLSGEAYFEVSRDSCCPFYVVTDEIYVRVYGTAFNINTNRLTEIQTMLVKGSVGIGEVGSKEEILLKPGEMAGFVRNSHQFRVEKVNMAQYIAWKDGYFAFENESLEEIMGMLGRWYDVDVFYSSNELKSLKFTGYLRKYEDIEYILGAIHEMVDVRFSIKGQTIIISK